MKELLKVKNLSKAYSGEFVLKNFNLTLNRGEIFGLLGSNGAGKSTAMECILGTKNPNEGAVSILGFDPRKNRKQLFQKVGVQFQESNYQNKIKVYELCQLTASLYSNPSNWIDLLSLFKLCSKSKNLVSSLSGGERQKLFIVLALIPNPKIVFLDELTTGLDTRARFDVWEMLENLKEKGLTIFLTSHFMDEVYKLCDSICVLKKGETVFYGDIEEAIEKSPYNTFEEAYLWYAEEDK